MPGTQCTPQPHIQHIQTNTHTQCHTHRHHTNARARARTHTHTHILFVLIVPNRCSRPCKCLLLHKQSQVLIVLFCKCVGVELALPARLCRSVLHPPLNVLIVYRLIYRFFGRHLLRMDVKEAGARTAGARASINTRFSDDPSTVDMGRLIREAGERGGRGRRERL